jgi:iron complex outermembrane receptor protein
VGRIRSSWHCGAVLLAALLGTASFAGDSATLSGRITASDGKPAQGTRVILVELGMSTFCDENGHYRFENLPPAAYHVQTIDSGLGSAVREVELSAGGNTLDIELKISPHQERIVVTATRSGRGSSEVVQPVTVLDSAQLDAKLRPTIGETLANEPGVSQTFYGSGASRPVIRGQSSSRVRVLESGLGVGDASSASPDHAVSTDPIVAEQVEVLRGPSTLLYGSSAVGGVVNILDGRIPDHAPENSLNGKVYLSYGSVADEAAGAVSLDGGVNKFAWHVDALKREADDYRIPGNAVLGDPTSASGTLPNSSTEAEGVTVGTSWVAESSFVGVSARTFDSLYGIPVELEAGAFAKGRLPKGAPPPPDSGIQIDMDQKRYDLRSRFAIDLGPFEELHFNAGVSDYEHVELEGSDVGTRFFVDGYEGRVELHHGGSRPLTGVVGVQYLANDQEAIGDEAFLPPSETDQLAVFALERLERSVLSYEFGLRFEATDTRAEMNPGRSFNLPSASFGLLWHPSSDFALGFSLTGAQRAPTVEELYSDGPHLATFSYEIGDPTLDREDSVGVDISFRKRAGGVTGELTLFANHYSGFIFESPTDEERDGLPVFQFTQGDADFYGYELDGRIVVLHTETQHDLDFRLFSDLVRGELTDPDSDLPFIPAPRVGVALEYRGPVWEASVEAVGTMDQNRVPAFVTPTAGYTLLNATVGRRLLGKGMVHNLMLRGTNLSNQQARVATSRIKDFVPLPGADVRLIYTLNF